MGKRLTITASSLTKISTDMTISPSLFPAVTVTVVRDMKIRTALKANQITRFATVPTCKKIKLVIFFDF